MTEEGLVIPFRRGCPSSTQGSDQAFVRVFIADVAFNIIFTLTATSGNILILFGLRKTTSIHSPSKLLLYNLATTDLVVGLVAHPLKAAAYFYLLEGNHDLYNAYATAASVLNSVSLQTMVVISIDRLLVLCLGGKYRRIVTLKWTGLVILFTWLMGVFRGAAFAYCLSNAYFVLSLAGVCLGTIIPTTCFIVIFRKLHEMKAKVKELNRKTPQKKNTLNSFINNQYKYLVCTLLFIFIALLLCSLPYITLTVLARFTGNKNDRSIQMAFILSETILLFNSSLNPLLCYWWISDVRRNIKDTLHNSCYGRFKEHSLFTSVSSPQAWV